jgi:hypothetical protein
MIDCEHRIYLSERNLRILLSKLERYKAGENTACAIVKRANHLDPYTCTMDEIAVIAIPDDKFYAARNPGSMLEVDEKNIGEYSGKIAGGA